MRLGELQGIVAEIAFLDWTFVVGCMGRSYFLQVEFFGSDNDTGDGKRVRLHGRKWYVSEHAIEDEVVKTAWAAVEFALLHEAREQFTYRGARIFHPHTDVSALVEVQRAGRLVRRPEPSATE